MDSLVRKIAKSNPYTVNLECASAAKLDHIKNNLAKSKNQIYFHIHHPELKFGKFADFEGRKIIQVYRGYTYIAD